MNGMKDSNSGILWMNFVKPVYVFQKSKREVGSVNKAYIAIDLKSFYASAECVKRGLNPLTTNLVVADESRTEKTICLAVSPSLKAYGIPGRARLFEVVQKVKQINSQRSRNAPNNSFSGKSCFDPALRADPSLELDYIIAPPQMAYYMELSTKIYNIYQKYVSPADIHVYSIDEVFIDATAYLNVQRLTAREFAMKLILDVLHTTGITATAGIGTNLYLCKIAMDIEAKHIKADKDGVRIAELDERSYRQRLWDHRPLTDFWRVGRGIAAKLEKNHMYTMGDVARMSLENEEILYKLFGINAELLIDHAWGWEPCTIAEIQAYRPESNSISSGQVLSSPYSFEKGKLIVREMTDLLVLELVDKRLVTDQMELTIGYDIENLTDASRRESYTGEVEKDWYGRKVPKPAHGTVYLGDHTSSTKKIMDAVSELYDRIVEKNLLVRRMYVVANHIVPEGQDTAKAKTEQMDLFTDYGVRKDSLVTEEKELAKERKMQEAMLGIKKKYGKNAILKGMNFEEGATAIERNQQVGGHKA